MTVTHLLIIIISGLLLGICLKHFPELNNIIWLSAGFVAGTVSATAWK